MSSASAPQPPAAQESFVRVQIGPRRFALPAARVAELAPPVRLHSFPHTSPLLAGVIVRRGRIVPVYELSAEIAGAAPGTHRFFLITRRVIGGRGEFAAIPVDGECELLSGQVHAPQSGQPAFVIGRLSAGEEMVDILDFDVLVREFSLPAPGQDSSEEHP